MGDALTASGYTLVMQNDGDLVLSGPSCMGVDNTCWASNTFGSSAEAFLQRDGNFVVYYTVDNVIKTWATHTYNPDCYLLLEGSSPVAGLYANTGGQIVTEWSAG
jgi:hypothetical protein